MIEFDVYLSITALCALVIVSYVFSLISRKTRIPTVLMLLVLGVAIRETLTVMGKYVEIPLDFIQFFGVLGLILVLLEAGLDLNLSKDKLPLMGRAVGSAGFVLALTVGGIALVMHYLVDMEWLTAFTYAVPLAVISSTIVGSSISYLSEDKREFLTYESSISDVLGILLFNMLIAGDSFSAGALAFNVGSIAISLVLSVVVSVILVVMLAKTTMQIKAFLVIAVLLLIYSVGHIWQLPTLLVVLIFGLIINNWEKGKHRPLHHLLKEGAVERAAETVKFVNAESAFVVRTLFFTMFGYMIDVRVLTDLHVLAVGGAVVGAILLVRYLYLRIFISEHILPELFFAPRGLVTIVLFYSIPAAVSDSDFDDGVVFFVVMVTTIIMMIGSVWFTPKTATREAEDAEREIKANTPDDGAADVAEASSPGQESADSEDLALTQASQMPPDAPTPVFSEGHPLLEVENVGEATVQQEEPHEACR